MADNAEKNRLPGWLLHTPDTTRYDNDTEQEENETEEGRSFHPFVVPRRCSAFSPQPPTTCFLEFDDIRSQVDRTYLSTRRETRRERKEREREDMVAREPCNVASKDRLDRSSYGGGAGGGEGGGGPGFIPHDARGH